MLAEAEHAPVYLLRAEDGCGKELSVRERRGFERVAVVINYVEDHIDEPLVSTGGERALQPFETRRAVLFY